MCGIYGKIVSKGYQLPDSAYGSCEFALETMKSRGPDAAKWVHPSSEAIMGQTRLSVLDIRDIADPPMQHRDRFYLVYNGEIYNFRDLRRILAGRSFEFRTTGDTEVLLYSIVSWGDDALNRLDGIFSFAFYDAIENELMLAVDHVGVKPLYFREDDGNIEFCSDFRVLLHGAMDIDDLDAQAVAAYTALRYVPGGRTVHKAIKKLRPGTCLRWRNGRIYSFQYWAPKFFLDHKKGQHEWEEELRETFSQSVAQQWVSDVENGVLLSGGFDSSALVGQLAIHGYRPKCFSCTFIRPEGTPLSLPSMNHDYRVVNNVCDETGYAEEVAQHHGCQHSVFKIPEIALAEAFTGCICAMGEPMASIDALGHYILASSISPDTKVLLNGVGSDELFAGYTDIYFGSFGRNLHPKIQALDYIAMLSDPDRQKLSLFKCLREQYQSLTYAVNEFERALQVSPAREDCRELINDTVALFLMAADLPWWELKQADAMYMAFSHEVRVPFLSRRMVDIACRLPSAMKYAPGRDKLVLKAALRQLVPRRIVERAKCPSLGLPQHAFLNPWFNHLFERAIRDPMPIFDRRAIEDALKDDTDNQILDLRYRLVVLDCWWRLASEGKLLQ